MPHRSPITCVDADPASGRLVTGGYDGRVVCRDRNRIVWEVAFDDLVNDVRFSPAGDAVAVAVADRFAFVLDVADGRRVRTLGPHGDDVNVVRWLPDGHGLICVMDHLDPVIRIWSGSDGGWQDRALPGHRSGVFGAAAAPDGRRLATAAEDRTARIWDLDSLAPLQVLAHPGDPEAIDWSPDGALVATGCDDGVCRLWDPDRGVVVRTLDEAGAAVRFVRFSADGARLLVGAYDATLREYDTAGWRVLAEYRAPFQWERAAVHAGSSVVVGSFGADVVTHPQPGHRPPAPTFGINSLTTAGSRVVIGRDDGAVLELDATAATGLRRTALRAGHQTIVNSVAISPDGRTIASADYRGVVQLVHADGTAPLTFGADAGGPINSVVWAPDGSSLYTAGYDGVIRQWQPDGTASRRWAAHHGPIKSLAWSVPAGLLVAGSSDGTLSAWHDEDNAWRARAADLVLVNAVAADQAGRVISASRDLRLRSWDARTGALLEALPPAHTKSVKAVACDPDGDRLVSGAYDGTALLWERTGPGWRWRRLDHHGKPGVPAVAFARDVAGTTSVLTAGWDGSVARWDLDGRLIGTCTPWPS